MLIIISFVLEQSCFAQVAAQIDLSGMVGSIAKSVMPDKYRPLHLRYMSYDSLNNSLRLMLDKGDSKDVRPDQIKDTTSNLMKYFFVGLSLPNEDFWVNLRPDSPNEMINADLAKTDVGRVLLEADVQLKKDTANHTSPKTPAGKAYWDQLYQKAEALYGSENITIPTLTRPWIVPDEIIVREARGSAYIYKATLKVMLEQDYLKNSSTYNFPDERAKELNEYSSRIIRETIIPKLTKEINSSKRYASLRQVYYSLILAQWFKAKYQGNNGIYSRRIDSNDLTGLTSKTAWDKDSYFKAYQRSFKGGEYNIKEPGYSASSGQVIRSYFSGGISFGADSAAGGIARCIEAGLIAASRIREFSGEHAIAANVGAEGEITIEEAAAGQPQKDGGEYSMEADGTLVPYVRKNGLGSVLRNPSMVNFVTPNGLNIQIDRRAVSAIEVVDQEGGIEMHGPTNIVRWLDQGRIEAKVTSAAGNKYKIEFIKVRDYPDRDSAKREKILEQAIAGHGDIRNAAERMIVLFRTIAAPGAKLKDASEAGKWWTTSPIYFKGGVPDYMLILDRAELKKMVGKGLAKDVSLEEQFENYYFNENPTEAIDNSPLVIDLIDSVRYDWQKTEKMFNPDNAEYAAWVEKVLEISQREVNHGGEGTADEEAAIAFEPAGQKDGGQNAAAWRDGPFPNDPLKKFHYILDHLDFSGYLSAKNEVVKIVESQKNASFRAAQFSGLLLKLERENIDPEYCEFIFYQTAKSLERLPYVSLYKSAQRIQGMIEKDKNIYLNAVRTAVRSLVLLFAHTSFFMSGEKDLSKAAGPYWAMAKELSHDKAIDAALCAERLNYEFLDTRDLPDMLDAEDKLVLSEKDSRQYIDNAGKIFRVFSELKNRGLDEYLLEISLKYIDFKESGGKDWGKVLDLERVIRSSGIGKSYAVALQKNILGEKNSLKTLDAFSGQWVKETYELISQMEKQGFERNFIEKILASMGLNKGISDFTEGIIGLNQRCIAAEIALDYRQSIIQDFFINKTLPETAWDFITADSLRELGVIIRGLEARNVPATFIRDMVTHIFRGYSSSEWLKNINTPGKPDKIGEVVNKLLGHKDISSVYITSIFDSLGQEKDVNYWKTIADFLIEENNRPMLNAKASFVYHCLINKVTSTVFNEIVDFSAASIDRKDRLEFFRGLNNMWNNKAILPQDNLQDWKILLGGCIQKFHYPASRDIVLIHRYLSQGKDLASEELARYKLNAAPFYSASSGEKGVQALSSVVGSFVETIVENKGIPEDYLANDLMAELIAAKLGFTTAQWGHGARGLFDFKSFVMDAKDAVKKGRVNPLPEEWAHIPPQDFAVRQLIEDETKEEDIRARINPQMDIVQEAVNLSLLDSGKQIDSIKERARDILSDLWGQENEKLRQRGSAREKLIRDREAAMSIEEAVPMRQAALEQLSDTLDNLDKRVVSLKKNITVLREKEKMSPKEKGRLENFEKELKAKELLVEEAQQGQERLGQGVTAGNKETVTKTASDILLRAVDSEISRIKERAENVLIIQNRAKGIQGWKELAAALIQNKYVLQDKRVERLVAVLITAQVYNQYPGRRNILQKTTIGEILSELLETRNELLKEHILQDMKEKNDLIKTFNVKEAEELLKTISSRNSQQSALVNVFITKGELGELAGDIGDACYTKVPDIMQRAAPSGITAAIFSVKKAEGLDLAGSMLILENKINGEDVLVLRAINPRAEFLSEYSARDFVSGAIAYARLLAERKGIKRVVVPIEESGATSNRDMVIREIRDFVKGDVLNLDQMENFNGYDITKAIVREIDLDKTGIAAAGGDKKGPDAQKDGGSQALNDEYIGKFAAQRKTLQPQEGAYFELYKGDEVVNNGFVLAINETGQENPKILQRKIEWDWNSKALKVSRHEATLVKPLDYSFRLGEFWGGARIEVEEVRENAVKIKITNMSGGKGIDAAISNTAYPVLLMRSKAARDAVRKKMGKPNAELSGLLANNGVVRDIAEKNKGIMLGITLKDYAQNVIRPVNGEDGKLKYYLGMIHARVRPSGEIVDLTREGSRPIEQNKDNPILEGSFFINDSTGEIESVGVDRENEEFDNAVKILALSAYLSNEQRRLNMGQTAQKDGGVKEDGLDGADMKARLARLEPALGHMGFAMLMSRLRKENIPAQRISDLVKIAEAFDAAGEKTEPNQLYYLLTKMLQAQDPEGETAKVFTDIKTARGLLDLHLAVEELKNTPARNMVYTFFEGVEAYYLEHAGEEKDVPEENRINNALSKFMVSLAKAFRRDSLEADFREGFIFNLTADQAEKTLRVLNMLNSGDDNISALLNILVRNNPDVADKLKSAFSYNVGPATKKCFALGLLNSTDYWQEELLRDIKNEPELLKACEPVFIQQKEKFFYNLGEIIRVFNSGIEADRETIERFALENMREQAGLIKAILSGDMNGSLRRISEGPKVFMRSLWERQAQVGSARLTALSADIIAEIFCHSFVKEDLPAELRSALEELSADRADSLEPRVRAVANYITLRAALAREKRFIEAKAYLNNYETFLRLESELSAIAVRKDISREMDRQLRGLAWEAWVMKEKVIKKLQDKARALLVIGNLSYGWPALAPLVEKNKEYDPYIKGTDIPVLYTRVGSTEARYNDYILLDETQFTDEQLRLFLEKSPNVVIADASVSVANPEKGVPHLPASFKGYRNFFIVLDYARHCLITGDWSNPGKFTVDWDPGVFLANQSFVERLLQTKPARDMVNRIRAMRINPARAGSYKFRFFYEREESREKHGDLSFRFDKFIPVPKVDMADIGNSPVCVFVQTAMHPEDVPARIKDRFIGGEYTPAYFDDTKHFDQLWFERKHGQVVLSNRIEEISQRLSGELAGLAATGGRVTESENMDGGKNDLEDIWAKLPPADKQSWKKLIKDIDSGDIRNMHNGLVFNVELPDAEGGILRKKVKLDFYFAGNEADNIAADTIRITEYARDNTTEAARRSYPMKYKHGRANVRLDNVYIPAKIRTYDDAQSDLSLESVLADRLGLKDSTPFKNFDVEVGFYIVYNSREDKYKLLVDENIENSFDMYCDVSGRVKEFNAGIKQTARPELGDSEKICAEGHFHPAGDEMISLADMYSIMKRVPAYGEKIPEIIATVKRTLQEEEGKPGITIVKTNGLPKEEPIKEQIALFYYYLEDMKGAQNAFKALYQGSGFNVSSAQMQGIIPRYFSRQAIVSDLPETGKSVRADGGAEKEAAFKEAIDNIDYKYKLYLEGAKVEADKSLVKKINSPITNVVILGKDVEALLIKEIVRVEFSAEELEGLIKDIKEDLMTMADMGRVNIVIERAPDFRNAAMINYKFVLKRALVELLSNAIKHSALDSQIKVTIGVSPTELTVVVGNRKDLEGKKKTMFVSTRQGKELLGKLAKALGGGISWQDEGSAGEMYAAVLKAPLENKEVVKKEELTGLLIDMRGGLRHEFNNSLHVIDYYLKNPPEGVEFMAPRADLSYAVDNLMSMLKKETTLKSDNAATRKDGGLSKSSAALKPIEVFAILGRTLDGVDRIERRGDIKFAPPVRKIGNMEFTPEEEEIMRHLKAWQDKIFGRDSNTGDKNDGGAEIDEMLVEALKLADAGNEEAARLLIAYAQHYPGEFREKMYSLGYPRDAVDSFVTAAQINVPSDTAEDGLDIVEIPENIAAGMQPQKDKVLTVDERLQRANAFFGDRNQKDGGVPGQPESKGGIDFRGLPIANQPAGGVSNPAITRVPSINIADLDKEWEQITRMSAGGMTPSIDRIAEFLGACENKGRVAEYLDNVLACIAQIMRNEEDDAKATDPQLKNILVKLESGIFIE